MKSRDWESIFSITWKIGLAVAAVGQIGASFSPQKGGTASEAFGKASRPLQFAIVGAAFATIAHWVWAPPGYAPETVIEHADNVTVEATQEPA